MSKLLILLLFMKGSQNETQTVVRVEIPQALHRYCQPNPSQKYGWPLHGDAWRYPPLSNAMLSASDGVSVCSDHEEREAEAHLLDQ